MAIKVARKILTICQGGNVRSVGLAYLLKYKYNLDAIACSAEKNSTDTLLLLCEWADLICPMQPEFSSVVPKQFENKIRVIDVGPDRFGSCFHPQLHAIIEQKLAEISHGS